MGPETEFLPNTGLRLRYSTAVFSTAVEGQEPGRGIEPDLMVSWSLKNYIDHDDPVWEAALKEALP
jgi:C-terminal processing protease CtpA/Prc